MRFKRIFLLILDSLGVGEAIDANEYGDNGTNTLKHIVENYALFIPNLSKLGFLDILTMNDNKDTDAYYSIIKPQNIGKDSVTMYYEMMGINLEKPFKTYYEKAFPREFLELIEKVTGKRIIGNKIGKGIDIINELGERHLEYGSLIIYTTNDSSIYISAHEDVVPIPKLYIYCEKIRRISQDENWNIARVVAKPFTGKPGKFRFTNDRKEYPYRHNKKSVLKILVENGLNVISIGRSNDLFDNSEITKILKTQNTNMDTISKLTDIMTKDFTGLCIASLSDFDRIYAKNKDLEGYAKKIEEFDIEIPLILNKLDNDDLLIITGDRGNDLFSSHNHGTRENVPLIIFSRLLREPKKLEPIIGLSNIGATILDNFGLEKLEKGESFLDKLI